MVECNKIFELYKGHYRLILDFPDKSELYKIINPDYKYVWMVEHKESHTWSSYHHSLFGIFDKSVDLQVRWIKMEVLLKTEDFLKYVPYVGTIKIIQTNIVPPGYLALERLKGKGKYDLLKSKIDYLFELDMPGAIDYSPITSPNLEYLESLQKKLTQ